MSNFNNINPNFYCQSPYGGQYNMYYTPADLVAAISSLEIQISKARELQNANFQSDGSDQEYRNGLQRTIDILNFMKFMAIKEMSLMHKLGDKYNEG